MSAPIEALAAPITRRCVVAELASRLGPEGLEALHAGVTGQARKADGTPMNRTEYAFFFEDQINAHLPEGATPHRITPRQMQRHARGECACGRHQ